MLRDTTCEYIKPKKLKSYLDTICCNNHMNHQRLALYYMVQPNVKIIPILMVLRKMLWCSITIRKKQVNKKHVERES